MNYTSIEWDHAALILIDVQHDFVDGAMPVAGTLEVLPALAELTDLFRAADRPIAHIIRLYVPGGSDVDTLRRADIEQGLHVAAPETDGALIPAALTGGEPVVLDTTTLLTGQPQTIGNSEAIIFKPRWSAFYRTGLQEWLAERTVSSVVVAGCNLPKCPRATLYDATERDFRAAVVVDATSQTTPARLEDLGLIGVQLHSLEEVRTSLPRSR